MEKIKAHFEVELDDKKLDFDGQCNYIDYGQDIYLRFYKNTDSEQLLLGMIPHSKVKAVYNVSHKIYLKTT